jgi:hypothetical protein
MNDGIEKRKYKRYPTSLKLTVSTLFKQNNVQIQNIDSPIEICDISKSGIGFRSEARFPLHYYFNARLTLGEHASDTIFGVVEIVRSMPCTDDPTKTIYGCQFVGLPSIFDYIFDEYEKKIESMNS